MTRAVVFAYHNVGVRCLRVLLARGIEVPLVVSHADQPGEEIWFESVARHAGWHGIPVITPEDANTPEVLAQIAAAAPDFIFSFYYRQMLGAPLLGLAKRGAYNMHGSLLPQFRGRVPVNWAVLHGATETGATLHVMADKPDAGAIVDQQAVPILPDDTAFEVFQKVTVAAELTLHRCLPALVAGNARLMPQNLAAGSYHGRRTAADGRIDWRAGVASIHNLVRAVAPPYPGAFSEAGGLALRIFRSLPAPGPATAEPVLRWHAGEVQALCVDGILRLLDFELGAKIRSAAAFHERFGDASLPLTRN